MLATELMFYKGAPYAHIAAWEQAQRLKRLRACAQRGTARRSAANAAKRFAIYYSKSRAGMV